MGLYEGEHIKNMNKLAKVLPAKKRIHASSAVYMPFEDIGFNKGVDACAEAIEKANLVLCPTEEEIYQEIRMATSVSGEFFGGEFAKALLALLRNETQGEK